MKYDKPLLAMLIGASVLLPLEVFTQLMKYFNITTVSSFELLSMMFLPEPSWLLGIFAALPVGALAVFTLYQLTRFIGIDYIIIKGVIIGMFTYATIVIIFATLGGNKNMQQTVSGNLVHTVAAALGGAIAGYLMEKYLFAKHQGF